MRTISFRYRALWGAFVSAASVCWIQQASAAPLVKFSVIGDTPYTEADKELFQRHISQHNTYADSDFFVHVGDIKSGDPLCLESHYSWMQNALQALNVPAFIIPGDNEWNDCPEPQGAWKYWINHLKSISTNAPNVPVTRQSKPGQEGEENFAFAHNGVLFLGLNFVGGNETSIDWPGLLERDVEWLNEQLSMYTDDVLVQAAVIFGHADMFTGFDPATVLGKFVEDVDFVTSLQNSVDIFNKPVLFVHGDGHTYTKVKPWPVEYPNLTFLEVDGDEAPPAQVIVDFDVNTYGDDLPYLPFKVIRRPQWGSFLDMNPFYSAMGMF